MATLNPRQETMVREKVAAGLYATADEAIEAAFRLLDDYDRRRERLLAALVEGEQGVAIPYSPELLDAIDREVDERLRRGDLPSPDVCP